MINCLITGVGGQGAVLASKLISQTAMNMGQKVSSAETIGMAQRGGSVISHVRIGETYSPLIPKESADVIIAFEPAEAVRVLPYLKKDGALIVSDKASQPVTASLSGKGYDVNNMLEFLQDNVSNLKIIDAESVYEYCGSTKMLNVALVGAAISTGFLGINTENMISTMNEVIPPKFLDLNIKALKLTAGE